VNKGKKRRSKAATPQPSATFADHYSCTLT
jgi:hypothetical protein